MHVSMIEELTQIPIKKGDSKKTVKKTVKREVTYAKPHSEGKKKKKEEKEF